MEIEEKKKLEEEERLKKEANEREELKDNAKLITKITTESKRMSGKFIEYLNQKRIFYIVDFSDNIYTIQIYGLTFSETNKTIKKMAKQQHLKKRMKGKRERKAPAA